MAETTYEVDVREFCRKLPKVELHAHLNGSVSLKTLNELRRMKCEEGDDIKQSDLQWDQEFTKENFSKSFQVFDIIHKLVDNTNAVRKLTLDVIKEFAEDNVKYIEIRSTLKKCPGMSKCDYLETVISTIQEAEVAYPDIIVRFIVAMDRKRGPEDAMNTVEIANDMCKKSSGIIVGVDLCGDPCAYPAHMFVPVLKKAKEYGFKLTLHLAEIPDIEDASALLALNPSRIGHGTYLLPENGGSQQLIDTVTTNRIPLEVCLTSNLHCGVVPSYNDHHFCHWFENNLPFTLATDDKGVFNTTLSHEYEVAMKTLNLNQHQMWEISYNAINYIFDGGDIKEKLRSMWRALRSESTSAHR